jgi:PncC family amidohydrolase
LLLPGPPGEMRPIVDEWCRTHGAALGGGVALVRRVLKIANRPESHVDEVAQPIYSTWRDADPPITTTILAAPGQIELHLTARATNRAQADAALATATDALVAALAPDVFSADGRSMEAVVGDLLRERHSTIALAESCTGGLVASRLTDVAGSSDYVLGGVVAYANHVKTALLRVPEQMIADYGAVSEPVASAMAEGARERTGASIGVGVTGIAGPAGGTPTKPVGTVAIAVSSSAGARVRTYQFRGSRTQIKFQASQSALDMVRRLLLDTEEIRKS